MSKLKLAVAWRGLKTMWKMSIHRRQKMIKIYENFSNGIQGVVIGRALYDKKFTFKEALEITRVGHDNAFN